MLRSGPIARRRSRGHQNVAPQWSVKLKLKVYGNAVIGEQLQSRGPMHMQPRAVARHDREGSFSAASICMRCTYACGQSTCASPPSHKPDTNVHDMAPAAEVTAVQ